MPNQPISELQNLLNNTRPVLYYQPKVSMVTGYIYGAEALLRLQNPDGSLVYPDSFISQAEQENLITSLTLQVIDLLERDIMLIHGVAEELVVSFNISAKDFQDNTCVQKLKTLIRRGLLQAGKIELEITESSILEDSQHIRDIINELLVAQMRVSMDDFGTGFSTVKLLCSWPFTAIKLDKSIIAGLPYQEKSKAIVESLVHMTHQIGIELVAEGVETDAQYQFLLHSGCTAVQGFYISQALPLLEFLELVKTRKRWLSLPTGLIHMAQISHIRWRKAIINSALNMFFKLSTPHAVMSQAVPELDSHQCRLGEWYDSEAHHFKCLPEFAALGQHHEQLHALARQLLQQVQIPCSRTDIDMLLNQLTRESSKVLELLQQIEFKSLLMQQEATFTPCE